MLRFKTIKSLSFNHQTQHFYDIDMLQRSAPIGSPSTQFLKAFIWLVEINESSFNPDVDLVVDFMGRQLESQVIIIGQKYFHFEFLEL